MQHIAVNTRFLLPQKLEGIGWFTFETTRRMVSAHPDCTFHFLFDRPYHPSFVFGPNVVPHVVYPPARHPYLWYTWFELALPFVLHRIKADIFISPDGYTSLRSRVPDVMVAHDLAFRHFPQYVPPLVSRYYNHFTPLYLQKCKQIATVSQFTKQDIIKAYNIPSEKIHVLCNGPHEAFKPLTEQEKAACRALFTAQCPYFIFIGALHPRKNVPNMLKAFDVFKSENPALPHKMVIVGRRGWQNEELDDTLKNLQYPDEIIFLDYADRELLAQLLASAEALVYASLFEGFGIPVVEAFQCDVPVITSNVSSMPEVGGDAAIIVDPFNILEIAQALLQIATDKVLTSNLIIKGREQKLHFTWDKAAEGLWQSALKTLQV